MVALASGSQYSTHLLIRTIQEESWMARSLRHWSSLV